MVTLAETRYLLKDHLGSIDAILDSNGFVLERLSFDAWGKRRKTDWTSYGSADPGYLWQGKPVTRGFTGHEELDSVGLVHMNGRVYDPEIGRFLSADAVIQDTTNLQSLNAYSYVLNNPLSLTDPTGFFFKSLFRAIGNAIRSVFRAIGAVFKAILKSSIGRAIVQIAGCAAGGPIVCGALAGGLVLATGGSVVDALQAVAFAYISVGVWKGVHILGDLIGTTGTLAHSLVHGVVNGALSVAQGGSFIQGFASGAIADAGGLLSQSALGAPGTGGDQGVFLRTAAAATFGGLGAQVSGGKFANGAVTAAFAQLYNAESENPRAVIGDNSNKFTDLKQPTVESFLTRAFGMTIRTIAGGFGAYFYRTTPAEELSTGDFIRTFGTQVSGKFPTAPQSPGTIMYRQDNNGNITHYQIWGSDGLPDFRVDVTGSAHGGVSTPHTRVWTRDRTPDGRVFARPLRGVRESTRHEIP